MSFPRKRSILAWGFLGLAFGLCGITADQWRFWFLWASFIIVVLVDGTP